MLSKVCSAAVNGIDAYPVEVEVNEGYGDTVIVMIATHSPQILMGNRCNGVRNLRGITVRFAL
jgi:hypothetical protein